MNQITVYIKRIYSFYFFWFTFTPEVHLMIHTQHKASLKKKYLHKLRVSPKLVLLPFRKLFFSTDTRCHMSHYPRHKLVSQLQDIPECTRIFLRFPCASRSEKTEKNTFCCSLRGDNVVEAFKLRTSGKCRSL